MKQAIGLVLIVAGIFAGLYFGLWWAFIGGIIKIIEQIRAPNLDALTVALAVARIVFAAAIGWLSALVLIVPGVGFLTSRN